VLLVGSADSVGPMRAKGMAECCINPVAPALANAVHDATGVRYRALPLTPERIYGRLPAEQPGWAGRAGMDTERNVAAPATAIIGQKVLRGMDGPFRSWQEDLNAAAAYYPGFLGAEISAPTQLQPDWVVVYRFDSVAHLQAWINSGTRQTYLDVGAQYFDGP